MHLVKVCTATNTTNKHIRWLMVDPMEPVIKAYGEILRSELTKVLLRFCSTCPILT
jgi:hypothetical protein